MGYRTHVGARRLRALWLVPAVVASAAVGGGLFAPSTAHAATTNIEVCKSGANGMTGRTFNFTVTGIPGTVSVLGGGCSAPLAVTVGNITVTEAATSDTVVSHIGLVNGTLVSKSLSNSTITFTVAASLFEPFVTFTNMKPPASLKICKQAAADSGALAGQPFSFSVNGNPALTLNAGAFGSPNCTSLMGHSPGTNVSISELLPGNNAFVSSIDVTQPPATNVTTDLPSRTVSLTLGSGVNVVTYTNSIKVSAEPGFLEICKKGSDYYALHSGLTFNFSITDAAGNTQAASALMGQCTGPISVSAGPATITELSSFPYYLGQVSVTPAGRLISDNLSNQTVTVSVVAGASNNESLVTFVNDTRLGQVKICKALDSSNSNALAGHTFTFSFTDAATVIAGSGPGTLSIVANTFGSAACKFIPTPNNAGLPLGSHVSIREIGQPNVNLVSVSVSPSGANAGSTNTTAKLVVQSGVTTATFTNDALGTLEVCKVALNGDTSTIFEFVINGTTTIAVKAGQCSPAIQVSAGTATIKELTQTNFYLYAVTARGPNNEDRILSGFNPVTVSVPFGGVSNETLVTFYNQVSQAEFKICKTNTDGALSALTFHFTWTAGIYPGGAADLKPGECSGISYYAVQDPAGNPVDVTVTETVPAVAPGWSINSITYSGSGDKDSVGTANPSTFSLGIGANIVTYDNERNPLGGGL